MNAVRTRWRDTLVVTYLFAIIMSGTTLPTPLYAIYSRDLDLSPLLITVIYSVYAIGVLGALLVFGRVSDHVGRRPVLLAAAALCAVSAVLFATTEDLSLIFIGRILSGASAGLITGAGTAYLTELEAARADGRGHAAVLATVANIGGLGLGPLFAGVLAEHLPHPLVLPFLLNLVLLVPTLLVGVLGLPETVAHRDRWRAGVSVQRLSVPPAIRVPFLAASVAGFAAFALLGFMAALVGQVLAEGIGDVSHQTAGLSAFLLLGTAAAAQVVAGRLPTGVVTGVGLVLLPVGAFLLVAAVHAASLPLLVLAIVVGGFGDGLAFSAGLATVTRLAPPERRGEVISAFFVIAYVGITIPVVASGVLVTNTSLETAVLALASLVAVLSAGAGAVIARLARPVRVQQPQLK